MTKNTERRPGKILVMDDEQLLLSTARLMLSRLGYDAVLTGSGSEAVAAYAEHQATDYPVDVAVLDLRVPGGYGGIKTAEDILELDPEACLVLASGSIDHPALVDWEAYGFRAVLRKPFELAEMGMILGELMD